MAGEGFDRDAVEAELMALIVDAEQDQGRAVERVRRAEYDLSRAKERIDGLKGALAFYRERRSSGSSNDPDPEARH